MVLYTVVFVDNLALIKVEEKNLFRSRNNIFLLVSRFALFSLYLLVKPKLDLQYIECTRGASTSATWSFRDNIHRATRPYFALPIERVEFCVQVQ